MKTAVFAGNDLKKWREAQKVSAADLAELVNCDTTTIYRYESGKLKPDPDVMYQICEALGDADRWTVWMRSEYPTSYGRMHPETAMLPMRGAVMKLFAEMADVQDIERAVMRDAADGAIDDAGLAARLEEELTEMVRSAQRIRTLLRKGESENDRTANHATIPAKQRDCFADRNEPAVGAGTHVGFRP